MVTCSKCKKLAPSQVTVLSQPNLCLCLKCADSMSAPAQFQGVATRKLDGFCVICGEEGVDALVHDPRADVKKAHTWRVCMPCLLRITSRSLKPFEVVAMRRRAGSDTTFLRHYDVQGKRFLAKDA